MNNIRTARWTGAAYLALGVFGMAGYLVIRPQLHVAGDPGATLANLQAHALIAHVGVGLELAIVAAQALAALGFYALFRHDRPNAAFAVATFGMANAAAILASAAMLLTAVEIADGSPTCIRRSRIDGGAAVLGIRFALDRGRPVLRPVADPDGVVRPFDETDAACSRLGARRRWCGLRAEHAAGGCGCRARPTWLVDGLPLLATVGEFWMIGYLLIRGIRPASPISETGEATLPEKHRSRTLCPSMSTARPVSRSPHSGVPTGASAGSGSSRWRPEDPRLAGGRPAVRVHPAAPPPPSVREATVLRRRTDRPPRRARAPDAESGHPFGSWNRRGARSMRFFCQTSHP